MKVIFFIALAIVVYSKEAYSDRLSSSREVLKPILAECRTKYNVTEEDLKLKEPLPAEKKCYFLCVSQKTGLIDSKGNLNFEGFKTKMKNILPPIAVALAQKCQNISNNADPCLKAEAISNCIHMKKNNF